LKERMGAGSDVGMPPAPGVITKREKERDADSFSSKGKGDGAKQDGLKDTQRNKKFKEGGREI